MICLQCDSQIDELYVTAPAIVETLQLVGAEVTIEELRENRKHDFHGRYLPLFRLDGRLETLDNCLDHHTLELDDKRTEFHCPACNATLSAESVWAAVEQREVEA